MKLSCTHDPNNPDHLICESKESSVWKIAMLLLIFGLAVAGVIIAIVKGPMIHEARFEPAIHTTPFPGGEGRVSDNEEKEDNITLEAEALYYSKEGEQLGRGHWPLKAGETTKLKVFLKLGGVGGNSGGLSSVESEDSPPDNVVTARLAQNAAWTGFAPMGLGLTYEPATRIVRFIPGDNLVAIFEVAITPTQTQIQENQVLILDNLVIKAKNRETGAVKEIFAPNIVFLQNSR